MESAFKLLFSKGVFIKIKFIWDEEKRHSNLEKHGYDFAKAHKIFKKPFFTFEDRRFDYGEERFITLGLLDKIIVVVHTDNAKEFRIISMRKANKHEQKVYYKNIFG